MGGANRRAEAEKLVKGVNLLIATPGSAPSLDESPSDAAAGASGRRGSGWKEGGFQEEGDELMGRRRERGAEKGGRERERDGRKLCDEH
eukprot:754582-Hanusia_phi.AAC.7